MEVPAGRRREDARLVTGAGRFIGNLVPEGALHCAFVRSFDAHGELRGIDTAPALDAPGVVAAFRAVDLDLRDIPGATGPGPGHPGMARPPLARDRVRYTGEPLAVVLATGPYLAADAAERVTVDVEPLPVVADVEAALTGQRLLFPALGTNVVDRSRRGTVSDAREWPVVASVTCENQRLAPVPIEPLGIIAVPEGDGLTVWCGHQAPHRLRGQLAGLLGLPADRMRVISPDVGGAFGMKGMMYPEFVVVAAAALRVGRPVVWLQTRSEQFLNGTHGRAQRHEVELAGDHTGRIRRARIRILADVGAYPHNGGPTPSSSALMATGAYDIADLDLETTLVVTNRAPTGSYRGAGRPEAAYAIERAIEAFALAAGLDSAEVRRRNFIPPEAMPYRTPAGALYDGGDFAQALDLALELADAPAIRAEQARGRMLGLGIGAFVERAGGAVDSSEYARVELDGDGGLVVRAGTASSGQGHETVWAALAADTFGVEPGAVRVLAGDTAQVAQGTGTFASRSAQVGGSAIVRTTARVREQAADLAGDLLEVAPEDLVLDEGAFAVRGDPHARVTLTEVTAEAAARGVELASEEVFAPGAQTFPYGVYVAVVEVDPETGFIDLQLLAAVDDCGTVLAPELVEGQVHGAIMQGVAQALYEEVSYDGDGQLRTASLVDYLVPAAPEMPQVVTGRLCTPAPSNPLGAKGTGESGCIGAPPAIVNAVLDALAPLGVTDLQMPLTPERVWWAIQAAGKRLQPSDAAG